MNKKLSIAVYLSFVLSGCVTHNTSESEVTPLPDLANNQISTQLKPIIPEPEDSVVQNDIYQYNSPSNTEVIRDGRYTLVSIAPEDGQKFLLEQVVSVNILPKNKRNFTKTVEQGLRSTLQHTGLDLCYPMGMNVDHNVSTLFSRPLPKVHYQFGPMKLYEALQMLAGPAYEMTLNEVSRTICFKTRIVPADLQKKTLEEITTKTTTEIIEDK
ncbi:PilL N-terminal domain-containing protein [Actinobacillus equuli subsp. equuli]|uniref:PilL N-terminal domain-containing protein n=1 Tax=Actinobacillus equuli subsp. equuli TaxID=202947 RepID=A0A9X4JEH7_ACTEU|nr:PilL N-terminal domain-containing protein [Actinobacillus equuli]MDE8035249.1 PilL N-terminal domain-containing protein [Actinobacillus equuli subsp. equuli]